MLPEPKKRYQIPITDENGRCLMWDISEHNYKELAKVIKTSTEKCVDIKVSVRRNGHFYEFSVIENPSKIRKLISAFRKYFTDLRKKWFDRTTITT